MLAVVAHSDRWTRLMLAEALTAQGCEVAEASNGGTALRLIRQAVPALVVLGQRLSELSGPEVAAAMRSDPVLSNTGVFVLH
jgi:CheY-like chemotaxis protein